MGTAQVFKDIFVIICSTLESYCSLWNECHRKEIEWVLCREWRSGWSEMKWERESQMMICFVCYCGASIFCFGALIRQNVSHAKSSFPRHRFLFNMWITCWKLSYQSDYFAVMWLNIKWFHTYSELLHRKSTIEWRAHWEKRFTGRYDF